MSKNMESKNEFFNPSSETKEEAPRKIEIITITDTHNDLEAMKRNLQVYGVLDESGEEWKEGVTNIQIVHTGDVINKESPSIESLKFLFHLKATVPEGCSVKVPAGNHEIEYLINSANSIEELPIRQLIADNMVLLSVSGPVLFVHGHPSRSLLKKLQNEGVKAINKGFKEAMQASLSGDAEELMHFAFKKKHLKEEEEPLQKKINLMDFHNYYERHGKEIQKMLLQLGIKIVVHGHASQQSGVQNTDEFHSLMPHVRFMNGDASVSKEKKLDPGETAGNEYGSFKISIVDTEGKKFVDEIVVVNKNTHEEVEKRIRGKKAADAQIKSLIEDLSEEGEEHLKESVSEMSHEDLLNLQSDMQLQLDEPTASDDFNFVYETICKRLDSLDVSKEE